MGITIREGFVAAFKRQKVGIRMRDRLVPDIPRWNRRLLRHVQQWQEEVAAAVRARILAGDAPTYDLLEEEVEIRLGPEPEVPADWILYPRDPDEEEEQDVAAIPLPLGPAPGPQGAMVPAEEERGEEREEEEAAVPVPAPAPTPPEPESSQESSGEAGEPPAKSPGSGGLTFTHCSFSLNVSP